MKKNNIQLSLILLITIFTTLVKSQSPIMSYITDINSHMSSIPYVFEGQVQKVEIFAGDKNGNPLPTSSLQWNGDIGYWMLPSGNQGYGYSKATIKVCKIYKGDIRLDENNCFTVLTRAHSLNNVFRDKSDASHIYTDYIYMPATHLGPHEEECILPHNSYPTKLYLCDQMDDISTTNYAADEYYVSNFHVMYDAPMFVPVEVMGSNGIATMQTAYCQLFAQNVFHDQTEFQTFLAAIGLNPKPKNFCDWDEEHNVGGKQVAVKTEESKINHAANKTRHEQMVAKYKLIDSIKGSSQAANKTASNNNLFVDIRNERIVNISSQPWFEFDIYINANNSGLYFDNCLTAIDYNTAAFGPSVTTNNNIVCTAAAPYQISTYENPQNTVNDNTSSEVNVSIGISSSVSSWNRILTPTTPQLLMTVRMKIIGCNVPANITAGNTIFTSFLCRYTTNATATSTSAAIQSFDNVTYTGNITDNTCEPIITSWVNGIPGGINRTCSISGKYFGDTKGTVIFKNADQGTVYPLQQGTNWGGLQKYDISSWSDNQIVFRMPSLIDSAVVMVNNNPVQRQITPGSGKFQVKNFIGQLKESSGPIYIPYCVSNIIDYPNTPIYKKYTLQLSASSGNGYKIQNDPAVTALDPDEKAVFRRAMNDWRCATEINWSLGQDTTLLGGYSETDNVNQIVLSTTLSPAVARTRPQSFVCPPVNGVRRAYLKAFDMQISTTLQAGTQWQFDTTGVLVAYYQDFYAVTAHELGHAHLLEHINDSTNNLMWFASYVYGYTFPNRFKVWYSFDAEDGANYVIDSLVGNLSCAPNHIIVPCQNCTGFPGVVGLKNQVLNLDKITVYPNPSSVNQDINIKFDLDKPTNVRFTLYTITGSLIKYTTTEKTMKENVVLPTDVLDPGMYMLQVDIGGKKQVFKLIKQ